MFGNSVTDFSQQAIGTYGYTVKIATDPTSLNAAEITAVQAQASASDTPSPVTSEVSINTIQGYLNDFACPDLAFNFDGGNVTIFFKTSVFAYVSATRVALVGKRNAQATTADSDLLDIVDDDLGLLIAYILQSAYLSFKNTKSKAVEDSIETEERKITG